MAEHEFAILEAGPTSHVIAEHLKAPVAETSTSMPDVPLIVLVSSPGDVNNVRRALERGYVIAGVIAWRLPEAVLSNLLEVRIPVFIGLPERAAVLRAMGGRGELLDRGAERTKAAQYSVMETLLGGRMSPINTAERR